MCKCLFLKLFCINSLAKLNRAKTSSLCPKIEEVVVLLTDELMMIWMKLNSLKKVPKALGPW